jgi:hypothetical protein
MARFIQAADMIRAAFGCAVIVVHHCGIAGSRPRGHTSLSGADDAQIAVEREDNGIITATMEHMKDSEARMVILSRLHRVELGANDGGDQIASCVILPAEGTTSKLKAKVNGAAKIALDLLRKALADHGEPAPISAHIPPQSVACEVTLWRHYCYQGTVAESDDRDTKRQAFYRASKQLQAAGLIGAWRDRVWLA